jgi:hypothetical protein
MISSCSQTDSHLKLMWSTLAYYRLRLSFHIFTYFFLLINTVVSVLESTAGF